MKVVVTHEHKCKKIAEAHNMMEGRSWWVGELLEPVEEWPLETHCLHMKTPAKDITFLCNRGDFEALAALSSAVIHIRSMHWLESVETAVIKKASK